MKGIYVMAITTVLFSSPFDCVKTTSSRPSFMYTHLLCDCITIADAQVSIDAVR